MQESQENSTQNSCADVQARCSCGWSGSADLADEHECRFDEQRVEPRSLVMCDRCPNEVEQGAATRPWATALVECGACVKLLILCPRCHRDFRLWCMSSPSEVTRG